jgi:hypothetical protein
MLRVPGPAFVVSLFVALFAAQAQAGDWTDTDCRRWEGTPQYAACAQAQQGLARGDCSQWLKGGEEFVKCQRARNAERVQRCVAQGEARRQANRNAGWADGIETVDCPLVNEKTGEEIRQGSAGSTPSAKRTAPRQSAAAARAGAAMGSAPPSQLRPVSVRDPKMKELADTGPLPPMGAPTGSKPVQTGPLSWSNIRPAP